MENDIQMRILEWKEMNDNGQFKEAREYYFNEIFEEIIHTFEKKLTWPIEPVDVLFSVLGFTPEPVILAARALKPKRHIIIQDKGMTYNEENMTYLRRFLPDGFDIIDLGDETFGAIYDTLKELMTFNAGRNYAINITGGKKSMAAAAGIFARDYNMTVLYVDFKEYDANFRKPTPGSEYLNIVYTPTRDMPEFFH